MSRTLWIFCLVATCLAAKDRQWQPGQLLDKALNPYFRAVDNAHDGPKAEPLAQTDSGGVIGVNVHHSEGDVIYETFVIQGIDRVYMVESTRLKAYKAPHLSLSKTLSFAVEKDKLYFQDLDKTEYETKVLKQAPREGYALADAASPALPAEPAKADPKLAKAEVAAKPDASAKPEVTAKVEKPKSAKPDSVFATGVLSTDDLAPAKPQPAPKPAQQVAAKPAPPAQPKADPAPVQVAAVQPKQNPVAATVQSKPTPKPEVKPVAPAPKPEPKVEAVVEKPAPKAQPAPAPPAKPESPVARASSKDRAWQSGQLLSVANNNYFFNVTYSSDLDGSSWPFSQGSDGRLTVTGQIANPTSSLYTYDNYIIESEFVAYLVQRMRPKSSPIVALPGTHALKFAVEKTKLWVLDDMGREYETKVIKLVQKDSIGDPASRVAAR